LRGNAEAKGPVKFKVNAKLITDLRGLGSPWRKIKEEGEKGHEKKIRAENIVKGSRIESVSFLSYATCESRIRTRAEGDVGQKDNQRKCMR